MHTALVALIELLDRVGETGWADALRRHLLEVEEARDRGSPELLQYAVRGILRLSGGMGSFADLVLMRGSLGTSCADAPHGASFGAHVHQAYVCGAVTPRPARLGSVRARTLTGARRGCVRQSPGWPYSPAVERPPLQRPGNAGGGRSAGT
ncbi:DUF6966 domain-containing protein [Nonomuraea composti]|uniref:DUF6966 domain-containing protein n=1 Tax=Nonomuraea composti TaxID=2720023 RepID=UPI003D165A95